MNKGRDPKAADSTEFVHDVARNGLRYDVHSRLQNYIEKENPRGLPEKWLERFANLDGGQLAIDVIRAYDRLVKQEKQLGWERIWRRILTAGLAASWVFIGWLIKFLFDHPQLLENLRRLR